MNAQLEFAVTAQPWVPHEYQQRAIRFGLSQGAAGFFLDPGLGKSSIVLAILKILKAKSLMRSALIVAPLRVCYTVWPGEIRKWLDFNELTFEILHGPKKDEAVKRKADIYLLNPDGFSWFLEKKRTNADVFVMDESTLLKHTNTQRFKLLKPHLNRFRRRYILTGTPAPNGYLDLFGQIYILDGGNALGRYITHYRVSYFYQTGFGGYEWKLMPGMEEKIQERISPLVMQLSAQDYLKLPELIENVVYVDLPTKAQKVYDELEEEFLVELAGETITAATAATASMKCIAEGTEVLSFRGWVPIEFLLPTDQVWDGEEWVSYVSLICNGYKKTIECFGVYMTPDHKVLTTKGWKDADACHGYDRQSVRLPNCSSTATFQEATFGNRACDVAGPLYLWKGDRDYWGIYPLATPKYYKILWLSKTGGALRSMGFTWYDWASRLGNLVSNARSLLQATTYRLEKLWGSWNNSLHTLAEVLQEFLGRHGAYLEAGVNTRSKKQRQRLLSEKLSLGNNGSTSQQPTRKHPKDSHAPRKNDSSSNIGNLWYKNSNGVRKALPWVNWGSAGEGRQSKVYDLIDCGPRNRFVVRGNDGPLIVHNCRQISNGFLYNEDHKGIDIHEAKLDACKTLVDELNGKPVFIAYEFEHDRNRLMKLFGKDTPYLGGGVTPRRSQEIEAAWNRKEIPVLLAHPKSAGHGLNLQGGGSTLIWFGLTWDLELYEQTIKRIHRQGQQAEKVFVHYILARQTIDEAVYKALRGKARTQTKLLEALKAYGKAKRNTK